MTFRCFHEKLAQPPRFVGDRLLDGHLVREVLLVQLIDTLAIDVSEPRVVTCVPRRYFASAIADHEPKISELQKGPAVDPPVLGQGELFGEVRDRSFEITDG